MVLETPPPAVPALEPLIGHSLGKSPPIGALYSALQSQARGTLCSCPGHRGPRRTTEIDNTNVHMIGLIFFSRRKKKE